MSIPHFKSNHDWEAFTQIFDSQWHCKRAAAQWAKMNAHYEKNFEDSANGVS